MTNPVQISSAKNTVITKIASLSSQENSLKNSQRTTKLDRLMRLSDHFNLSKYKKGKIRKSLRYIYLQFFDLNRLIMRHLKITIRKLLYSYEHFISILLVLANRTPNTIHDFSTPQFVWVAIKLNKISFCDQIVTNCNFFSFRTGPCHKFFGIRS
jgi:hypothetical protein